MKHFLKNPFTSCTVIGFLLMLINQEILGISYDEQGVSGFLYWTGVSLSALYWFVAVFISKITSGPYAPNIYLVAVSALFLSVILDTGVRAIWRLLSNKR